MTTKWTCQKNRVLPVTNLFFWKFCLRLRTSYNELICCTNKPDAHICTFCKRWNFIWWCFFPVSIPKIQIFPLANRKCFELVNCQAIDVQSCFTVPRHAFLIGFSITITKPWIISCISVESLETINKLCTLYLSSKPDASLSHVTIVKLHEKKCLNYFRVTTSPLNTVW